MKVNINSRNVNRVCEAYSHLCRALSTPSMFFTSITCSVITFFNDIGQRKTSFWVLEEVRRLKANDASIFIALIPTDKESAMCVLHELSALSELVCELRVPLPTCTWDLLLTLINTQGNLTLTVNLLICAMQINFFRPEIDVLEKLLFDCSRSGPALLKPLSNLVCALSAEYLNRIKSSLHNLLSFLTHSPPPAQQIKHVIIRHCQGHGINLLPNSDVSGYEVHSEGGSNTDNLTQCSLGVHNGDGYITQYGILPGNHGSQHVHVSSGIRGFSSLENRISSGAFEYHTDRIKNNEDTQLFVGFGNGKDSNINKILPENSRYSNKNFMGNRSFTTKKISFESRSTTGGIYRQESCSREDRISRVYAYQHGVASTGPRVQNNTTYSSGINREESLALAGSGFQNQLISTTTSRHKDQLILPAPDYHSKSYTVNTGCQDQLKTQTEIPSLGLNSHKRSINLSHQNLPAVPVNKRGPSSGNHRWTVLSKREVELNRLGTKSSDFNVPQCQGSLDHTQTSVENKDSESMPGYSQTYKEPRCQESLLEDVAGVVSRHMSAPSNSTSHGSYINDDKQDRGKIPIYYSKNALYLKNRQQKLNVQQHIEECSPRGTGRSVQAQEGILQCSSENTRLHYGNNQSSSCSGIPMMRVPLPNAESKQLCSSVCESFSKMKTTGMSSELTSLGAQTDLITQNIEEGQTSCNREQSNVQNYVQTTAMINETDELPSHTASISKFKDGNCNLSCPVSDVIKEKCVLQRSVSKKYIQEKPVKVPKPCVSTISKPRELALPSGLMIDVDGCSYSPDAYRRSFSELEGNSDIVGDLRMIAGLNSERLKKIKLVKIFDLLTGKDAIHSVGANFAEILKSMTGISDERSQAFAPAEELIGRLGVSLMVECIEQCYPDQALCIIQSLHDHKIYFFSCVPINKKDPPSEHRLAVMALEVLHQMHNLKLFTVILEEIYWSGGTEDVKLRLNVLSKVLSSYLDSLACGSASISKETLRFITKILGSLVKYYQHDLHTIACEYHQIMDLSEFLKKAWEYSRSCEDEEANSELHHVICSSLECGVHLPPEVTHNLEHHGTDVTYQMNKSTQENEKIPHPQQNLSSNDHLKGPCEARRGDHLDVPDCINDSESRSIINFSSGTGGNVSVRTHYQDLRGAGNIKRGAIGTRSHSIQVTAKGDEAISNTNNTMEFNNETHHATKLMGGSRGRGRSGFFTTRNKRRKGRPWKGCRRPLMRPQISEW